VGLVAPIVKFAVVADESSQIALLLLKGRDDKRDFAGFAFKA
jgi:hypothetical protein